MTKPSNKNFSRGVAGKIGENKKAKLVVENGLAQNEVWVNLLKQRKLGNDKDDSK